MYKPGDQTKITETGAQTVSAECISVAPPLLPDFISATATAAAAASTAPGAGASIY